MPSQTSIVGRLLLVFIGLSLHCGEDGESLESQCQDITDEAYRKLAIAPADLSCNTDEDCALVYTGVSCLSGCAHPIAVSQASSLPERVQNVETGLCADYEQLGCPRPILLPCVPPILDQIAVCNAGRCDVQNPR